jgi:hypothetical protein
MAAFVDRAGELDTRALIGALRGTVIPDGWDPASGGAYIRELWAPDVETAAWMDRRVTDAFAEPLTARGARWGCTGVGGAIAGAGCSYFDSGMLVSTGGPKLWVSTGDRAVRQPTPRSSTMGNEVRIEKRHARRVQALQEQGGALALAKAAAYMLDVEDPRHETLQEAAFLLSEARTLADHAALMLRLADDGDRLADAEEADRAR